MVGERGLSLSGGQRQRVALARALVTDPRILVLDDATSSVDAQTEEEIHATLRQLMAGRTTLVVAHRRSTLRLADRVVVVDGGRVVDEGTHGELVGSVPLYRQLLAGPGDDLDALDPRPTTSTSPTPGDEGGIERVGVIGSATDRASPAAIAAAADGRASLRLRADVRPRTPGPVAGRGQRRSPPVEARAPGVRRRCRPPPSCWPPWPPCPRPTTTRTSTSSTRPGPRTASPSAGSPAPTGGRWPSGWGWWCSTRC